MDNIDIIIRSEKGSNVKQNVEIIHGGIMFWQEHQNDAFWLKLFLRSEDEGKWPKIRIRSSTKLYDIRDYSHMFFAWDNQMSTIGLPELNGFLKSEEIIYKVDVPEEGQEENQFCYAVSKPIKIEPSRVKIEKALNHIFFIEPVNFLNADEIKSNQIGIWILCRSQQIIKSPRHIINFSFNSNIPFNFIKIQFVLPSKSYVEEENCKTSKGLFKLWANSNSHIAQPGWISLQNPISEEFRLISSYYNTQKPILSGKGTLVYSEKNILLEQIIIFKNKIVFQFNEAEQHPIVFEDPLYSLILIFISHYKESIIKPLDDNLITKILNELHAGKLKKFTFDDVLIFINSLNSQIQNELSSYISLNVDEIITADGHKYHVFNLLRKNIRDAENIDIEPILEDYNEVSKLLLSQLI